MFEACPTGVRVPLRLDVIFIPQMSRCQLTPSTALLCATDPAKPAWSVQAAAIRRQGAAVQSSSRDPTVRLRRTAGQAVRAGADSGRGAARHSQRVSGGGVSGGETCGVSSFALRNVRNREVSGSAPAKYAKCEMSSFALRNMRNAKCPISHLRNMRNAKCPVSHFEICEMRSVRFRTCEIQKVSKVIY